MVAITDAYVQCRPIRPLPKRRLRSRLSEDARVEIFAPSPKNPTKLFNLPFGPYGDLGSLTAAPLRISTGIHTDHNDQDFSDDDDSSQPGTEGTGRGLGEGTSLGRNAAGGAGGGGMMDSYDWVENTNNKKKRKIPSPVNPGGASGNGNGGTSTMSMASQSSGFSPNGPNTTPRSRWKSGGATQRSPLAVSSSNHTSIRRMRRYPQSPLEGRRPGGRLFSPQSGTSEDSQSTTSSQNESYHASSSKPDLTLPHQSQFTFEHITPASTSLALQAIHPNLAHHSPSNRDGYPKTMSTVGTQTSPNLSTANTYPPAPTPRKKGTRKLAPQQRQRRQVSGSGYGSHNNNNNNNNNGEIWICEFCEYESIFGEPPEALMRQYELKDRRERRRLREKQRLLEKAKQKGKKNQARNNPKRSAGSTHHSSTGNTPPPAPPPSATDSQGTQSDSTPLASANATPALKPQKHSQQVQTDNLNTGNSHHVSSGRGAAGGSISGGGKAVATRTSGAGGSHVGGQFGAVA